MSRPKGAVSWKQVNTSANSRGQRRGPDIGRRTDKLLAELTSFDVASLIDTLKAVHDGGLDLNHVLERRWPEGLNRAGADGSLDESPTLSRCAVLHAREGKQDKTPGSSPSEIRSCQDTSLSSVLHS